MTSLLQVGEKERKLALDLNYMATIAAANPNLQTADLIHFLHKAQLVGADPRLDQIYLIPFRTKLRWYDATNRPQEQWITKASTVFSYHFFLQKADSIDGLEAWDTTTEIGNYFNPATGVKIDTLQSTTTIERKDRKPLSYTAWFPEFVQTNRDGKVTASWAKKPHLMLEKCSLANAVRRGFAKEFSGVQILEETHGFEYKTEALEQPEVEEAKELPKTPEQHLDAAKNRKTVNPGQLGRLYTIATNNDWTREQVHEMIKKVWNYTSTKQLGHGQYDYVCKKIEAMGFAEWGADFDTAAKKQGAGK